MKKKAIIVVSILLIIGIAVGVAIAFNKSQEKNKEEVVKTEATGKIPQVDAYYGDEKVGEIDGYTMEMKEQHIRDVVVPIAPSRQSSIKIKTNDNKIKSISYEVESVDDQRLIDNGEITDWTEKDGTISCHYQVSAIMKTGTEYFLKIIVSTDKYEEITYYARAMVTNEEFVPAQMKFAKNFSDATFDESKATDLVIYIEPDAKLANDNLGQVTLKSNYSMLTWGNLKPSKVGKTQITAKEFCIKDSGEAGTYTMNYQIESTNAEGVTEKYNVAETITVWTFAEKQYVLAYEREMNQVWEANENNVGSAFIDLGIQNITDIKHVESANQQYVAFAINGDVYVMDVLSKQVKIAYKLNANNSDILEKTRAKVITVDDSGNLDYMIYGYSQSDNHVGKNGISIMEYNYAENKSTEKAFIPCQVSAAILEKQLSELCYIGDGTAYIMLDNSIYFANLKTKEWGTLASNLAEGACVISGDGTTIAYNTNCGEFDTESITVVNLTDGKKSIIAAEEGKAITVCGYTGANLVYGIGENSAVKSYKFFPMDTLKILDSELKEVKTYQQKNIYITGVEITDTIINIKRWKKGKAIDDDQLLDNTEEKITVAKSSYYNDDFKQKELALSFTNNLDANLKLKVEKMGEATFDDSSEVNSVFEENATTRYYAYGYGKLQGIYTNKNDAIKAAKTNCGLVANENGQKIWVFEENYE